MTLYAKLLEFHMLSLIKNMLRSETDSTKSAFHQPSSWFASIPD